MTKFYSFLIGLLGATSLGWASTPANPSFLTAQESEAVVREIDSICGDSWCSGDLNYRFDQLVCNSAECYFDIQVITRNDPAAGQSRPYRCQLNDFHSASDLVRVDSIAGEIFYRYTDKLYDAVSQCISAEVPVRHPVIYLPKSSACRDSLRKQPRFKSAAHSVYAEVFYELENKKQASARVLTQMVEQYAGQSANCTLEYYMAFEDEVLCERVAGQREICSLPTDLGHFVVIRDYVDSAAVIYIENSKKTPQLGSFSNDDVTVKLAQPEACYTELLNLDGKQSAQTPFASSDHRSYFVSAKGMNLKQDARKNAAQLVNRAVAGLEKIPGGTCKAPSATLAVSSNACRTLGGVDVCVFSQLNSGYFVVTPDAADGAFVTFIRFD